MNHAAAQCAVPNQSAVRPSVQHVINSFLVIRQVEAQCVQGLRGLRGGCPAATADGQARKTHGTS